MIDITRYDIALVIVIKVVRVLVLVAVHVIIVDIVIAHFHKTPGQLNSQNLKKLYFTST